MKNDDALNAQIKATMRRAMRDLVSDVASKPQLTDDDARWLATLVCEVRDRLDALTPQRRDLHAALAACIDVELIRQMLLHAAADRSDVQMLTAAVFDRLQLLCAPSQDAGVRAARSACEAEPTAPRVLAALLEHSDAILSEIEQLSREARRRMEGT